MYSRPILSLSDAKKMIDFILEDVQREPGWDAGALAICDHQGCLIAFMAEDESNLIARLAAVNKARTAATISTHTNNVRQRNLDRGFNTLRIGTGIDFVTDAPGGICIYDPESGLVLGGIGCSAWGVERDTGLPKKAIEIAGLAHNPPPDSRLAHMAGTKFVGRKKDEKTP